MAKKDYKNIDIFIKNRNIEEEYDSEPEMADMVEMAGKLNIMLEQLAKITNKQEEHDQVLTYLNGKIEQPRVEVNENREYKIDLFRIPDSIKSIPSFDGNRKQLTAWLKTAEDTLNVFAPLVPEQQLSLYVQAINNKIEGKAKDVLCLAGNPQSFLEVKQILIDSLGDKQELSFYKAQLWTTKQVDNMSIHQYFNKIKEIVQNIKMIAKQKTLYNNYWIAIGPFIEEDALAAFISGLKKPYFGYAQAAKPQNLEEAYAFLCKFSSNEVISNAARRSVNENKNHYQQRVPQITEQANTKRQQWPVQEKSGRPTPMEIDSTLRSRRTVNQGLINNHEIPEKSDKNTNVESPNQEDFWDEHESDTED